VFIDAAASFTDARVWLLATLAFAYGLVRLVEAYGLWRGRRWAEWFAAVSGAHKATWLSLGALLANMVIVGVMINTLLREYPPEPVNAAHRSARYQ
jgi:uncharacterized membrane protein (DUF2068 family)